MGITTAERNRRKRERKKREKKLRRKQDEEELKKGEGLEEELKDDLVVEYVVENVQTTQIEISEVLEKFQHRAALSKTYIVSDDELRYQKKLGSGQDGEDEEEEAKTYSKRQLRSILRPSVADLKRRVKRADLVEAHDVTSPDPDFLIVLKGLPGTVPVPRHWGRKRKYLQGKRGFEKPPFQLPDFIVKTGITELRDTVAENEASMSVKQSNRARVAPKMGQMDVDYRTLHSAFFHHQTKPTNLTRQGDLYYEGKELETRNKVQPGAPFSKELKDALGMTSDNIPPPWLVNMQRYGPPPSYPSLKIPGLNSPLPSSDCQYGYHVGGWGKPPVDNYGRPLYGGNPFDLPSSTAEDNGMPKGGMVTSDGKALESNDWGALPVGGEHHSDDEEEDESDEEMEESVSESEGEEQEEQREERQNTKKDVSMLSQATIMTEPVDLRKDDTEETRVKELYTILEEKKATIGQRQVFGSQIQYTVPGGAESVLSKATGSETKEQTKDISTEEDRDGLDKNFKF